MDKSKPSLGALRTAEKVMKTIPPGMTETLRPEDTVFLAQIIDSETGLPELIEALDEIDEWWDSETAEIMGDESLDVAGARISWPFLKKVHSLLNRAKGTTGNSDAEKAAMDAEWMRVMGVDGTD